MTEKGVFDVRSVKTVSPIYIWTNQLYKYSANIWKKVKKFLIKLALVARIQYSYAHVNH